MSFAVSAIMIRAGVRERPAADSGPDRVEHLHPRAWLTVIRSVAQNRKLRALLGLSWLAGLFIVPEGLAAPYAHSLGGGPKTIGLLLAALPAGTLIGTVALSRFVSPTRRTTLVGPLAVLAGLPLIGCALRPGLAVTLLLWTATGAFTSYLVQIIAEYSEAVPNQQRGQAIGVLTSGMLAIQGLGLFGGGLLSQAFATTTAIAMCGGFAIVLAVPLALGRRRHGAHSVRDPARQSQQSPAW
jgi:predicted MFS family arabinose efflux permease